MWFFVKIMKYWVVYVLICSFFLIEGEEYKEDECEESEDVSEILFIV